LGQLIDVINPRTGKVDEQIRSSSAHDIAQCASRLRQAQVEWGAASIAYRCEVLKRWSGSIVQHMDTIVAQLSQDTGRKALSRIEVFGLLKRIEYWCEHAPQLLEAGHSEKSDTAQDVSYSHQYVAYPLLGVISPWNFPLLLSMIDTIPALLAGCAVMIKPSEITPRFVQPLRQSLYAVPELASVLEFAVGDGSSGQALIDHADVICFTGSVATGRQVAVQAAGRLIPAFLELGGKDPAVVLEDADVTQAATAILRASVGASGQACQSIERVYVAEEIYSEFVSELTKQAQNVQMSIPETPNGHIGPMIFPPQAEIITTQLKEAQNQGAEIQYGSIEAHEDGGLWFGPVIVTGVDHSMRLMREETFGPVIPVMSFSDPDEAVALANDSDYGLSAAVFGADQEQVYKIARQINAGAVSLNDAGLTTQVFDVEKDSFQSSGLGRSRMGPVGFLRFFRRKSLLLQTGLVGNVHGFREGS